MTDGKVLIQQLRERWNTLLVLCGGRYYRDVYGGSTGDMMESVAVSCKIFRDTSKQILKFVYEMYEVILQYFFLIFTVINITIFR